MIEVEVKLKINDPELIKSKLYDLGFEEIDTLTEIDTYFDSEDSKIRNSDTALRIRETINHTTNISYCQINFKGHKYNNESMTRPEYETLVNDSVALTNILNALGYYGVEPVVKKTRTELKLITLNASDINACIDTVECLGTFLELEIITESEKDKDRELLRIDNLLTRLGYSREDTTTTSYLSQLMLASSS